MEKNHTTSLETQEGATVERVITLSVAKAIGLIFGTALTGLVVGAGTAFAVARSDHAIVIALDGRVAAVETGYVRKDVLAPQLENLAGAVKELKESVTTLNGKLDTHLLTK